MPEKSPVVESLPNEKWKNNVVSLLFRPSPTDIKIGISVLSILAGYAQQTTSPLLEGIAIGNTAGIWKYIIHKIEPLIQEKNGKNFRLGEHGTVCPIHYNGAPHKFASGEVIRSGDLVGNIDIMRRLSTLPNNIHGASRLLMYDLSAALYDLATQIEDGDFPENIKALTGISHLAGTDIARVFGFEIDEPDFTEKMMCASVGLCLGKNNGFPLSTFIHKFKKSKRAWITPEKIVQNKKKYQQICSRLSER